MNTRFEQLILGAVLTGALALTGCSSGGGGGDGGDDGGTDDGGTDEGGDEPGESSVQFLGGHASTSTELQLFFSDSVQLPEDVAALAAMFTLSGTVRGYGIDFAGDFLCNSVQHNTVNDTYFCANSSFALNKSDFTATYTLSEGATVAAITGASLDPDDDTRINLTLDDEITTGPDSDDGDTGGIRLAYTGGDGGLTDANGDLLVEFSAPEDALGNIAAYPDGAPVMMAARVIGEDQIELTFSEPVQVPDQDLDAARQAFILGQGCLVMSSKIGTSSDTFVGHNGLTSPWDIATFADSSLYYNPRFSYNESAGPVSISDLSLPTDRPNVIVLSLTEPIPAEAANDGLRLTYLPGETGAIETLDSIALFEFGVENDQPGNVVDWHWTADGCRVVVE